MKRTLFTKLSALILVLVLCFTVTGCNKSDDTYKGGLSPTPTGDATITEAPVETTDAPTPTDSGDATVTEIPTDAPVVDAEDPITMLADFKDYPAPSAKYADYIIEDADISQPFFIWGSETAPTDDEVMAYADKCVIETDKFEPNGKKFDFPDDEYLKVIVETESGDVYTDIYTAKVLRNFILMENNIELGKTYEVKESGSVAKITPKVCVDYKGRTFNSMTDAEMQEFAGADKTNFLAYVKGRLEAQRVTAPMVNAQDAISYVSAKYKVGEVPEEVKTEWFDAYKKNFGEDIESVYSAIRQDNGNDAMTEEECLNFLYEMDVVSYGSVFKFIADNSIPEIAEADRVRLAHAYCKAYGIDAVDLPDDAWYFFEKAYSISLWLRTNHSNSYEDNGIS